MLVRGTYFFFVISKVHIRILEIYDGTIPSIPIKT